MLRQPNYLLLAHENIQHRKTKRKYIKFIIISIILMMTVGGVSAAYFIRDTVQPPELPSAPPVSFNLSIPVTEQAPEPVSSDEYKEGYWFDDFIEMPNPLTFDGWDRRDDFFTVLIIGLDGGGNANVIMVGAYDHAEQRGYLLSIPRDTRVDVQRNRRKIVAAYPVGQLNGGGHQGGIERMKQEVQTLIGFKPDFYVLVDFNAFIRIIDAFGGVEIYVPFDKIYDDPYQDLHIDIPAGLQMLNGEQALHFVRYRRGNDRSMTITDYQRIENQQLVISTLLNDMMSPRTILQIPEMIRTYREYVSTDLQIGEKLWFAAQFFNIRDVAAISTYTLPMLGTSGAPAWYELPDRDGILNLVNRSFNPFNQYITEDMLRIVQ